MHSCLYRGTVLHARRGAVTHRFRYPAAMAYLDLEEVDSLARRSWLFSTARFAPASFRTEDHSPKLFGACSPAELAGAVRRYAGQALSRELPPGPVRVLTQLRHFGQFFSPLNLFFCGQRTSEQPTAVVAEVSNTPWNERRLYVLDFIDQREPADRVNASAELRFRHRKDFHVSPFMDLAADYCWRVTLPGERLRVAIRSVAADRPPFTAALNLERIPWNDWRLATQLARFPVSGLQTLGAIYWQAFRLWKKRCRYYPHPRNATPANAPRRPATPRRM